MHILSMKRSCINQDFLKKIAYFFQNRIKYAKYFAVKKFIQIELVINLVKHTSQPLDENRKGINRQTSFNIKSKISPNKIKFNERNEKFGEKEKI